MTTENPFDGRDHGSLVFRARAERNFFIGRLSRRSRRNGFGTIPSVGKLVRMPYAICRLVPGLMLTPNRRRRARRRRQMRCGLMARSMVRRRLPAEDKRPA